MIRMEVLKSKSLAEDGSEKYYIDNVVTCASKHLVGDQNTKENLEAEEERDATENKVVDQSQGNNEMGKVIQTIEMEEIQRKTH